jgi:hypothetical protein
MRRVPALLVVLAYLLAACTSSPARSTAPSPTEHATTATSSPTSKVGVIPPYDRAQFAYPTSTGKERWDWTDLDRIPALNKPGNQCDGREEALARWSTNPQRSGACRIVTATVFDFYTGTYHVSVHTSTLQADHVVSLADAWRSGAWRWTRDQRVAFANWDRNVVMTTPDVNGCSGDKDEDLRGNGKCDRGPDTWAPISPARACAYVTLYEENKRIWHLGSSGAVRTAIRNTKAATCGRKGRTR